MKRCIWWRQQWELWDFVVRGTWVSFHIFITWWQKCHKLWTDLSCLLTNPYFLKQFWSHHHQRTTIPKFGRTSDASVPSIVKERSMLYPKKLSLAKREKWYWIYYGNLFWWYWSLTFFKMILMMYVCCIFDSWNLSEIFYVSKDPFYEKTIA